MGDPVHGPMPTDVLISAWGLDARCLGDALRPRIGPARLFFAGALADDLGTARGPLEIVALTEAGNVVSNLAFEADTLSPCPVPLRLTVMPIGVVRSWSVPLVQLLTGPTHEPPEMPLPEAVGIHALYTHLDLLPGTLYLAAEVEETRVEVLPLYVATRELYRQRRMTDGGTSPEPVEELTTLVRALLGAWGYCNPCPGTLLPLFDRAAYQLRLAPAVPASVRRAVTDPSDTASRRVALESMEEICANDPVLRFCASLVRDGVADGSPVGELAALASG